MVYTDLDEFGGEPVADMADPEIELLRNTWHQVEMNATNVGAASFAR